LWQNVTLSGQPAFGEIRLVNTHDIPVIGGLACDLAKKHISSIQGCQNKCGSDFLTGQIRERKRRHHHTTCYKSFHASSSSGEDQSSAQAVCVKGKKDSLLGDDAAFRLFKKAKKSRTSRRVSSGTLSSSANSIADDIQVKKPTHANRQWKPPEFIQERGQLQTPERLILELYASLDVGLLGFQRHIDLLPFFHMSAGMVCEHGTGGRI